MKRRVVGMDIQTCEEIRDYFLARQNGTMRWRVRGTNSLRPFLEWKDSPWLTPCMTDPSRPCLWQRIAATIKIIAVRAGLTKRISPHVFRHAGAIEMLKEGINLNIIQQQLGHNSIATTAVYLAKLCPDEVIQTINQRKF
jgi:site-specific recombinase XerD